MSTKVTQKGFSGIEESAEVVEKRAQLERDFLSANPNLINDEIEDEDGGALSGFIPVDGVDERFTGNGMGGVVGDGSGVDERGDTSGNVLDVDSVLSSDTAVDSCASNFAIEGSHVVVQKRDFAGFFKVAGILRRLGSDVYSRSFYLDVVESGGGLRLRLVYHNAFCFVEMVGELLGSANVLKDSYVVDIATAVRVLSLGATPIPFEVCKGSHKEGLVAHVLSGTVPVDTHKVSFKPYEGVDLGGGFDGEYVIPCGGFLSMLETVSVLASTGTLSDERAVYIDESCAYVYSGVVTSKIEGDFAPLVLQLLDMSILIAFFAEYRSSSLVVRVYAKYVEFALGELDGKREVRVVLPRRALSLDSSVKKVDRVDDGVVLNITDISNILDLLENLPANSGILEIRPVVGEVVTGVSGVSLISRQLSGERDSSFELLGSVRGSGVETSVRVSVQVLRLVLKGMRGKVSSEVLIGTDTAKLYLKTPDMLVVLSGMVVGKG